MPDTDEKWTQVFSWHAGRKFVFGLPPEEVAKRFGESDRDAAYKLAQENYRARKRSGVVIYPMEFIN